MALRSRKAYRRKDTFPLPKKFLQGSYTSHPYIYTLNLTFDTKFQIYPLYKIKLNHLFTPTFFFLLENITNIHPTFFWERMHRTNNKHYINPVLSIDFSSTVINQNVIVNRFSIWLCLFSQLFTRIID